MVASTLFDKVWENHVVHQESNRPSLIWIDRHLVHEVTSPQAFEGLRISNRRVRRPDLTFATVDHNIPTTQRSMPVEDPISRRQIEALERNCADFDITLFGFHSPQQGIVHVIGPELGITLPGLTIVCGDSHTSTHGAFGALALGIGTSEVEKYWQRSVFGLKSPNHSTFELTARCPPASQRKTSYSQSSAASV